MASITILELQCDGCGKETTYRYQNPAFRDRRAMIEGWIFPPSLHKDFCPSCAKDMKEKIQK